MKIDIHDIKYWMDAIRISEDKTKATMLVWAKIPESFNMKSLEFSRILLEKAYVAVSPGIGFGEYGDDFIRFSLIENDQRTKQALKNIKKLFK